MLRPRPHDRCVLEHSTIYDILARLFVMSALLAYIRIRDRGKVPNLWQTAMILLLFVAALDSKEIAIIAAPALLAYEVFFHGPPRHWRWLKQEGAIPLAAVSLALIYAAGKLFGPHALSNDEFYKIVYSPHRYIENNVSYAATILYHVLIVSPRGLIAAGLAMLLLLFSKRPTLQWCAAYILVATLSTLFHPTARRQRRLLLPLFGWALAGPLSLLTSITLPKWTIRLALTLLCVVFMATTASAWKAPVAAASKLSGKDLERHRRTEILAPSSQTRQQSHHHERSLGAYEYDMLFIAQLIWD